MLTRSAVVIRPGAPYFAWAAALPDAHLAPPPTKHSRIYLVPQLEHPSQANDLLGVVYRALFELELNEWETNPRNWPKDRSLAAFKKWFDYEILESVADLGTGPIEDDDL